MAEIEQTFAYNSRRRFLWRGLAKVVEQLVRAGCRDIYLDGSFVTEKGNPDDYDVCWNPDGVDHSLLDPVFFDFKNKYGGEFFPSRIKADGTFTYLEYFQIDKATGKPKGIIRIHLVGCQERAQT